MAILDRKVKEMTEERKQKLRQLLEKAMENLEVRCRPEIRSEFPSIAVGEYRSYLREHWETHANSREAALVEFNYNLHIVSDVTKSKLLSFLRDEFAEFIYEDKIQTASSFIHVGPPDGHPLDSLLDQFMKIALVHRIDQAISALDRCKKEIHGDFKFKVLLEGITLKEEVQVCDGIQLVPIRGTELECLHHLSGLPIINSDRTIFSFRDKTLLIISCCISPIFYKPPQLITEDYCVKEDLAFRTEMNGKQISESEIEDFYEKFCQTFSLACNLAVQFSLNWKFLAEDELFNLKFGYIIGRNLKQFGNSNYGSLIEHPQSKIDQAKSLYESLEKLNSNVREKLQIPINRWIKSKTATNPVDKIIDLGIALESLYLPKNNVEQLSFQFRLHAAWHLGKDKADRKMLIDEFKAIYTLRSKAVHNGEVPYKIKIRKGEEPIATTTFISKAQDLCRDSIIKILEDGKFPDWNDLILS